MSNSGNPIPTTLSDRLRKSTFEPDTTTANKPDLRELHLGSPVSPLSARPAASTSSSSSGSLSGRIGKPTTGNSHSGELSVECSPTGGSRRTSSVSSPVGNVLPAGNICPSGRPVGMMANRSPKLEVLSLGTERLDGGGCGDLVII